MNTYIILLAAGKGTRMNSNIPKVLHLIGCKPLIHWTIDLIKKIKPSNTVIISGYESDKVQKSIEEYVNDAINIAFAVQKNLKGTANAVSVGLKKIKPSSPKDTVLVLFGDDSALYEPESIKNLIKKHNTRKSKMTILTVKDKTPSPLGGLSFVEPGKVDGVLTMSQLIANKYENIHVACGAFCFQYKWLKDNLPKIQPSPLSGEYPLPALIKIAADQGDHAVTF